MTITSVYRSSEWLAKDFAERKARHPKFSMRAYARLLSVPSGRLSEYLSGKRLLTLELGRSLLTAGGFSSEEYIELLDAIKLDRELGPRSPSEGAPEMAVIDFDRFNTIAHWRHQAVLSMVELRGFRSGPYWIARRLGITKDQARDAIDRLIRVGLSRFHRRRLKLTHKNTRTPMGLPSDAVRAFHREAMSKCIESLEQVPMDHRDISTSIFAINKKKLPDAKNLINEFRSKMADLVESGPRHEVYMLCVQLVPVTQSADNPIGRGKRLDEEL